MPTFAIGTVAERLSEEPGVIRLSVHCEGEAEPAHAVAYVDLVGECDPGDRVLLNTTAVVLGLGTGGSHFVVANLTRPLAEDLSGGHIMKVRYTPIQIDVMAAEEAGSDLADALVDASSLGGAPVVVLSLHSQLAAACAVARRERPNAKIAFVMSDATALPVAVSLLVAELGRKGLLDLVVTCGQAFGGAIEAVNRYTGLLAAKVAGADVLLAGAGPGSVGTATELGHSGVDVGEWVNAVAALGGRPIVAPRISAADPRARHRGLSHHTRSALGLVALAPALVAVPAMPPEQEGAVLAAIEGDRALARHEWKRCLPALTLEAMDAAGLATTSMGRPAQQEAALFEAAGAAVGIALSVGPL
jgi:hypothetical protein